LISVLSFLPWFVAAFLSFLHFKWKVE
jgi:hypothetical protein